MRNEKRNVSDPFGSGRFALVPSQGVNAEGQTWQFGGRSAQAVNDLQRRNTA